MRQFLAALAVLAALAGCTAEEATTSSGSGKAQEETAATDQQATDGGSGSPLVMGGQEPSGEPPTSLTDMLAPTTGGATGATTEPPTDPDSTKPATGDAAKKFVGKYDGKLEVPKESIEQIKKMASAQGQPTDQVEQFVKSLTSTKVELELFSDGRFELSVPEQQQAGRDAGTWTLNEDGSITVVQDKLTAEQKSQLKANGMNDQMIAQREAMAVRPRKGEVSNGGKTIRFSETSMGMTMYLVFTKR